MKKYVLIVILCLTAITFTTYAQDTLKQQRFNLHFQQTIITQYKPAFGADYTGANSLLTKSETQSSITTSLF
ncbi:MAG: carbohydrate porin, partial [Mucilaginibacter sp.]|nr:carbohydrate porin [Mucilaginibacter sp.]